ncbi:amidohydrolase family protein, partial [Dehalococcoidia bacterium]|nr:amidohydrolase family protein [Dehalococcoidia bacterium]
MKQVSPSKTIRDRLGHPVIDVDGHQVNFEPPVEDYVRAIGGSDYAVRYVRRDMRGTAENDAERVYDRHTRPVWWVFPTTNAIDRAASALPKLLYERLDDIGLDYTVLFPSGGISQVYRVGSESKDRSDDRELRRVSSRAMNAYRSDICREFADRMTPALSIPMHSPDEAIEELEYAVNDLAAKVVGIFPVRRPVKALQDRIPEILKHEGNYDLRGTYYDRFGLDSDHDYDPFWSKCLELRVAVMSHAVGLGYTGRNSPTNHVFNHVGHFADAGEALCKSLFLGGVTRRFPDLKVAFLEGGVAMGARIYCDLIRDWEKRGKAAIHNQDPARLDRELFWQLHEEYGGQMVEGRLDKVLSHSIGVDPERIDNVELDDFAACGIQRKEDLR